MAWTSVPPDAAGYYWHRTGPAQKPRIVFVNNLWTSLQQPAFTARYADDGNTYVSGGLWAGPLVPPA